MALIVKLPSTLFGRFAGLNLFNWIWFWFLPASCKSFHFEWILLSCTSSAPSVCIWVQFITFLLTKLDMWILFSFICYTVGRVLCSKGMKSDLPWLSLLQACHKATFWAQNQPTYRQGKSYSCNQLPYSHLCYTSSQGIYSYRCSHLYPHIRKKSEIVSL